MSNILNIIDKIYENSHFTTILIVSIIVLVLLFIIVLFLGLKDAKKSKELPKKKEEDVKDITFDNPKEKEAIKEDVTFDMPVLTKNLEDFKKSFEEELAKEHEVEIRTTKRESLNESTRPVKILDMDVIEDTAEISAILPEISEEPSKKDEEDHKEIFSTKNIEIVEEDDNKLEFIGDDDF